MIDERLSGRNGDRLRLGEREGRERVSARESESTAVCNARKHRVRSAFCSACASFMQSYLPRATSWDVQHLSQLQGAEGCSSAFGAKHKDQYEISRVRTKVLEHFLLSRLIIVNVFLVDVH